MDELYFNLYLAIIYIVIAGMESRERGRKALFRKIA